VVEYLPIGIGIIVPALRRPSQNCEFKAGLGYIARSCLKGGKKFKKEEEKKGTERSQMFIYVYCTSSQIPSLSLRETSPRSKLVTGDSQDMAVTL
jgi:hypothetical protein